ncbi:MAG: DUF1365 domain-containing protein [Rhodospirillales bacterium]|nr:DUF1365 domain-containing protein [Rhodospirillales bacterium]
MRSAIYTGFVMHSRPFPRAHRFRYRIWWLLIDLDEVAELDRSLKVFSHNRFNLLAFHDRDYGHGTEALRAYVEKRLTEAGLSHAAARIELLTMPRLLGYAFNPLSVYFCRDDTSRIAAIIYEVHNTFGERHSYVIATSDDDGELIQQSSDKKFYVSPFMDMAMRYDFRVRPPADTTAVSITGAEAETPIIHATLHGSRIALTQFNLIRMYVTHPLLTLKVIGAIHWEALRIWAKRIGIRPRTPRRGHSATVGRPTHRAKGVHG